MKKQRRISFNTSGLRLWNRLVDRYKAFVESCSTPGVIPPDLPQIRPLIKFILLLWLATQLGKIDIDGDENLATPGRVIFCPNHSSYFDALIVFFVMRRKAHFMAAHDQFGGIGGLRAIVMAACGAFAVDKTPGKGKTVIAPSIELLAKGKALVIFPEGRINSDGGYSEFKKGAAWIAMGAWDKIGRSEPVSIVPLHICYSKRDPDSAQGGFGKMGLKWRGGAEITVGSPIRLDMITDLSAEALTDRIRCWITAQECRTAQPPDGHCSDEDDGEGRQLEAA